MSSLILQAQELILKQDAKRQVVLQQESLAMMPYGWQVLGEEPGA